MPRPITTVDRFMRAVTETRKRGYQYELVATNITDQKGPGNLKRFGSVYWRSPQMSLWNPFQVIAFELFTKNRDMWLTTTLAIERIGLPDGITTELTLCVYPYSKYKRDTRRRLLVACDLWTRK